MRDKEVERNATEEAEPLVPLPTDCQAQFVQDGVFVVIPPSVVLQLIGINHPARNQINVQKKSLAKWNMPTYTKPRRPSAQIAVWVTADHQQAVKVSATEANPKVCNLRIAAPQLQMQWIIFYKTD